ncbi:MAG TPA: hypothetical protein K8V15_00125 [Tessaracoccus flavescens]|uniref:Gram-positive cocci surface proteins LPxTG domain-containing protein n=1 Tax=Tessaracoccus flavescens TaxID=399497 RepID=A0A921JPW5_9ACTN|nr:hypothetical protein [Tessaracoccus flavescens]
MSFLQRASATAVVGVLLAGHAVGIALADDIEPPVGIAPIVGMTVQEGTDTLWLAGVDANEGVVTSSDGTRVRFSAEPQSVQALAWDDDRLWIGDIGDEASSRDFVVVYRLASVADDTSSYNAFDFEYEDGAQHATAMMISGRGRIYIATAGDNPGIYRAPTEPSRQEVNTLERVADAPAGVTDGAFMNDGTTLVLRTATGLEYIDALTWERAVTETLTGAPEGESVAVGADDVVYVGGNPTIRTGAMPDADVTTAVGENTSPEASPSTPASAPASAASGTSSETTAPDSGATVQPPSSSGPGRTGTLIAVLAAGVLALAAGAFVAIRR